MRRLDELNARAEDPNLWNDPGTAQKLMRERQKLDGAISSVRQLENELADATGMIEMAAAENDAAMIADAENSVQALQKRAEQLRLQSMLSGEADGNDTYLEIHAGAGGTESQDWAAMLFRMYTRWAEDHGYKLQLIEESEGEAAGIKSVTLLVKGENAYGWLKTEAGVHRLVRISPFDSNARRHTSFSSVTVYPVIDQSIEVDIPEKDVRIDVYRASGAGGQHVNKTESAVRITHIPSGIVVAMQEEKSQHKNRAKAMKILRARLYEQQRAAAHATRAADRKAQVGTGDRSERIRTYNFPQGRVSDHRINLTLYKIDRVMAGELDEFIDALIAEDQAARLAAEE